MKGCKRAHVVERRIGIFVEYFATVGAAFEEFYDISVVMACDMRLAQHHRYKRHDLVRNGDDVICGDSFATIAVLLGSAFVVKFRKLILHAIILFDASLHTKQRCQLLPLHFCLAVVGHHNAVAYIAVGRRDDLDHQHKVVDAGDIAVGIEHMTGLAAVDVD